MLTLTLVADGAAREIVPLGAIVSSLKATAPPVDVAKLERFPQTS